MNKNLVIIDMKNDFTIGALGNNEYKSTIPEVVNIQINII